MRSSGSDNSRKSQGRRRTNQRRTLTNRNAHLRGQFRVEGAIDDGEFLYPGNNSEQGRLILGPVAGKYSGPSTPDSNEKKPKFVRSNSSGSVKRLREMVQNAPPNSQQTSQPPQQNRSSRQRTQRSNSADPRFSGRNRTLVASQMQTSNLRNQPQARVGSPRSNSDRSPRSETSPNSSEKSAHTFQSPRESVKVGKASDPQHTTPKTNNKTNLYDITPVSAETIQSGNTYNKTPDHYLGPADSTPRQMQYSSQKKHRQGGVDNTGGVVKTLDFNGLGFMPDPAIKGSTPRQKFIGRPKDVFTSAGGAVYLPRRKDIKSQSEKDSEGLMKKVPIIPTLPTHKLGTTVGRSSSRGSSRRYHYDREEVINHEILELQHSEDLTFMEESLFFRQLMKGEITIFTSANEVKYQSGRKGIKSSVFPNLFLDQLLFLLPTSVIDDLNEKIPSDNFLKDLAIYSGDRNNPMMVSCNPNIGFLKPDFVHYRLLLVLFYEAYETYNVNKRYEQSLPLVKRRDQLEQSKLPGQRTDPSQHPSLKWEKGKSRIFVEKFLPYLQDLSLAMKERYKSSDTIDDKYYPEHLQALHYISHHVLSSASQGISNTTKYVEDLLQYMNSIFININAYTNGRGEEISYDEYQEHKEKNKNESHKSSDIKRVVERNKLEKLNQLKRRLQTLTNTINKLNVEPSIKNRLKKTLKVGDIDGDSSADEQITHIKGVFDKLKKEINRQINNNQSQTAIVYALEEFKAKVNTELTSETPQAKQKTTNLEGYEQRRIPVLQDFITTLDNFYLYQLQAHEIYTGHPTVVLSEEIDSSSFFGNDVKDYFTFEIAEHHGLHKRVFENLAKGYARELSQKISKAINEGREEKDQQQIKFISFVEYSDKGVKISFLQKQRTQFEIQKNLRNKKDAIKEIRKNLASFRVGITDETDEKLKAIKLALLDKGIDSNELDEDIFALDEIKKQYSFDEDTANDINEKLKDIEGKYNELNELGQKIADLLSQDEDEKMKDVSMFELSAASTSSLGIDSLDPKEERKSGLLELYEVYKTLNTQIEEQQSQISEIFESQKESCLATINQYKEKASEIRQKRKEKSAQLSQKYDILKAGSHGNKEINNLIKDNSEEDLHKNNEIIEINLLQYLKQILRRRAKYLTEGDNGIDKLLELYNSIGQSQLDKEQKDLFKKIESAKEKFNDTKSPITEEDIKLVEKNLKDAYKILLENRVETIRDELRKCIKRFNEINQEFLDNKKNLYTSPSKYILQPELDKLEQYRQKLRDNIKAVQENETYKSYKADKKSGNDSTKEYSYEQIRSLQDDLLKLQNLQEETNSEGLTLDEENPKLAVFDNKVQNFELKINRLLELDEQHRIFTKAETTLLEIIETKTRNEDGTKSGELREVEEKIKKLNPSFNLEREEIYRKYVLLTMIISNNTKQLSEIFDEAYNKIGKGDEDFDTDIKILKYALSEYPENVDVEVDVDVETDIQKIFQLIYSENNEIKFRDFEHYTEQIKEDDQDLIGIFYGKRARFALENYGKKCLYELNQKLADLEKEDTERKAAAEAEKLRKKDELEQSKKRFPEALDALILRYNSAKKLLDETVKGHTGFYDDSIPEENKPQKYKDLKKAIENRKIIEDKIDAAIKSLEGKINEYNGLGTGDDIDFHDVKEKEQAIQNDFRILEVVNPKRRTTEATQDELQEFLAASIEEKYPLESEETRTLYPTTLEKILELAYKEAQKERDEQINREDIINSLKQTFKKRKEDLDSEIESLRQEIEEKTNQAKDEGIVDKTRKFLPDADTQRALDRFDALVKAKEEIYAIVEEIIAEINDHKNKTPDKLKEIDKKITELNQFLAQDENLDSSSETSEKEEEILSKVHSDPTTKKINEDILKQPNFYHGNLKKALNIAKEQAVDKIEGLIGLKNFEDKLREEIKQAKTDFETKKAALKQFMLDNGIAESDTSKSESSEEEKTQSQKIKKLIAIKDSLEANLDQKIKELENVGTIINNPNRNINKNQINLLRELKNNIEIKVKGVENVLGLNPYPDDESTELLEDTKPETIEDFIAKFTENRSNGSIDLNNPQLQNAYTERLQKFLEMEFSKQQADLDKEKIIKEIKTKFDYTRGMISDTRKTIEDSLKEISDRRLVKLDKASDSVDHIINFAKVKEENNTGEALTSKILERKERKLENTNFTELLEKLNKYETSTASMIQTKLDNAEELSIEELEKLKAKVSDDKGFEDTVGYKTKMQSCDKALSEIIESMDDDKDCDILDDRTKYYNNKLANIFYKKASEIRQGAIVFKAAQNLQSFLARKRYKILIQEVKDSLDSLEDLFKESIEYDAEISDYIIKQTILDDDEDLNDIKEAMQFIDKEIEELEYAKQLKDKDGNDIEDNLKIIQIKNSLNLINTKIISLQREKKDRESKYNERHQELLNSLNEDLIDYKKLMDIKQRFDNVANSFIFSNDNFSSLEKVIKEIDQIGEKHSLERKSDTFERLSMLKLNSLSDREK